MEYLQINNLWINSLLQTFKQLGLDCEAISHNLPGFKGGRLAENCQLEVVDARRLWHRAMELRPDPLLGTKVGMQQNPRSTGFLLPVFLHSPTIKKALEHIAEFQILISESGRYLLSERDIDGRCYTVFNYIPVPCSVDAHPQQVVSVLVNTVMAVKTIAAEADFPVHISLPHHLPLDEIAKLLQCKVEASEGEYCVLIAKDALDFPVYSRDKHLYQLCLSYAEGLLRSKRSSQFFLDKVKSCIDGDKPNLVSIEQVASQLGMHKRALQRNLSEQGASFRQLKENLIKEKALAMLVLDKMGIEEIAAALGYADSSTFYRAFKIWFACTPKEFRENIGS